MWRSDLCSDLFQLRVCRTVFFVIHRTSANLSQLKSTWLLSIEHGQVMKLHLVIYETNSVNLGSSEDNFIFSYLMTVTKFLPRMIQDIRASKMLRFFKQGESERCEVVLNKPIYGTSVVPSHVLSVRQGNENFRSFLVHEIVFAANCATLPLFPYSRSPMDNNNLSKRFTLPVVSLEVPSLESFYLLHEYLYTKDAEHLLMILTGTPDTSRADLYRHMEFIRGLWRNAHALSVVEAGLYDLLKIAFLKTKAILHSSI